MKNNTVQKNIPRGWIETTLERECDVLRGQGLSKNKLSENGKNSCILYGELFTTYREVIKKIKSRTDSTEGIISKLGDILIPASTTTIAKDLGIASALNEKDVLLGGDINILRKKRNSYDSNFLSYYLTHYKNKELSGFAQGITIIHLYGKDFKQLDICIPKDIEEQQKIAEILGSVDEDILKIQEVIDKAEKLKKGLMQKIFTRGLEDGIKEIKLEDVSKVTSSKRIMRSEYVENGIPFYRSKEIIEKSKGIKHNSIFYISNERFKEIKERFGVPHIGDILITAVGTIGVVYLVDEEGFYFKDGNLLWIKDIDKSLNKMYLKHYMKSEIFQKRVLDTAIGSNQKALTIEKVEKVLIPVPKLKDQQKIAEILSAIDEKISINKKLKSKLIRLKKGLAQDLLSGKVRV
jgi:type I restriction enzyme S subunit